MNLHLQFLRRYKYNSKVFNFNTISTYECICIIILELVLITFIKIDYNYRAEYKNSCLIKLKINQLGGVDFFQSIPSIHV